MKKTTIVFTLVMLISLGVALATFPYTDYDGFYSTANETFTGSTPLANWSNNGCTVGTGYSACTASNQNNRYTHALIDMDTNAGSNFTLMDANVAFLPSVANHWFFGLLNDNSTLSSFSIANKNGEPTLQRTVDATQLPLTGTDDDGTFHRIKLVYANVGGDYRVKVFVNETDVGSLVHTTNGDSSPRTNIRYIVQGHTVPSVSAFTNMTSFVSYNGSEYLRAPPVPDTTPPTFGASSISPSTVNQDQKVTFYQVIEDDESLADGYLATNVTGTFANETATPLSGTSVNASDNVTIDIIGVVGYMWTAIDTAGNSAQTSIQTLTSLDNTTPELGGASISDTTPPLDGVVIIRQEAQDNYALSQGFLALNSSGTYVNESAASMTGTADNATKTITASTPGQIGYFWTIVDEAGNSVQSSISTFRVPGSLEQAVDDQGGFPIGDIIVTLGGLLIGAVVVIGIGVALKDNLTKRRKRR